MMEWSKEQQRERVRRRVRAATDPESYQYFPEKDDHSQIGWDKPLRVGIYARVSTPDPSQTTSFELQQKYYDDLVSKHPKWTLVRIYADEGKSGTTIEQRVELSIASVEKKTAEELISIRDKIIAMISFAISNNVNVKEEYLVNYDDSYTVTDKHLEYHKHHLLCAKKELVISNTNVWDYNFTLDQLPGDRDINDELEKLQPVFNLYVSPDPGAAGIP